MGEKLYYWEMKGAPLRIELGPRDLEAGKFILVARDNMLKQTFELDKIVQVV